jgi:hypothetical protein
VPVLSSDSPLPSAGLYIRVSLARRAEAGYTAGQPGSYIFTGNAMDITQMELLCFTHFVASLTCSIVLTYLVTPS